MWWDAALWILLAIWALVALGVASGLVRLDTRDKLALWLGLNGAVAGMAARAFQA